MKKQYKLILAVVALAMLCGMVWYVNERDAERQLQQLIANREMNMEAIQQTGTADYLFAPTSKAHQNLVYWGFDNKFKTVNFKHQLKLGYLHQNWTNWPLERNTLSAYIDEYGQLSLMSHFVGQDALTHAQVLVKVGNTVYDSTYIPTEIRELAAHPNQQKIIETNTYTAPKDQEIIRQIALAKDQSIQVLMRSADQEFTFTLPTADQQAIADCYALARRIQAG